ASGFCLGQSRSSTNEQSTSKAEATCEIHQRSDCQHDHSSKLLVLVGIEHETKASHLAHTVERARAESEQRAEQCHVDRREEQSPGANRRVKATAGQGEAGRP